ncbi:gfo/Idh/MocA family oxidoreductase [Nocardioides sp. zg-579]|uniref:Gfo/Idh/MocA family oxidoreductase n=1 Tax=Nocardioides marmotae TaxID=2663857 RepID=A0A6I3JCB3_9ACTN|nr:Gfo/Idh/MocA family oxidoreductase [Nocardioides marmotae]MCR6032122.1 gfo/Idh/MocA family oxidoreductase [Gordonia jinghuaiqii]MTB95768.1 gfo/Idh/MocA family oxidoreductase [Nocardioides marmotae]QKE02871.1 Gfo/Idh/MocA family oxidoreductase [Nocardioides marmotae]
MTRLRVGVVGLGEVAQVIHLPVLESLPDRFELAAVCDISPGLVKRVGERHRAPRGYTDVHEMIRAGGLDCVLVLNSDEFHAECTIAALDAGLDVLVEKPMCLSPREAEEIIAARDRSGRTVMVAYMRRFAPAFTEAVQRLPELGEVRYARVHDVIGENRLIVDQTAHVDRPDDVPQEAVEEKWARRSALVKEALGEVPQELEWTYGLLCGLGSHDLSALRELLGSPRSVSAARMWRSGGYVVALLDYGDFVVTYETGVDEQLRYDTYIEVYGATGTMRVQYDTPYVRHFPTTLQLELTAGDSYERSVRRPHLKDPYTYELEYFHDVVTTGVRPKTSPEDFVQDMALFVDIIRAIERS